MFMLGIALAVVILFLIRPGMFTRSSPDFTLFEVMFEESMAELEKKHEAVLAEIEEQRQSLVELQKQILTTIMPGQTQSPKVLAVLELAAEEQDVEKIAKKLGLGLGEVQLILTLNKTLAEKG